ncbi:hypothetical protein K8R78_02230 [bacterium]|nr:hypothetical protein [bacterium]
MKKLLALLVLVALGLTVVSCGGGAAETAEDAVIAALEAMEAGDKDAYMALAYSGDALGGVDMEGYEGVWAELENFDIVIEKWDDPVVVKTVPDEELEGDILEGMLMEIDTVISFDGVSESEDLEFGVVKTAEGWFIMSIDG